MKRFFSLILCITACLSLFSCRKIESDLEVNITEGNTQTTEPPTDSVSDTVAEPDTSVTLYMVGDVLLHDKVRDSGVCEDGTYNYDHFFANVSDDIERADIALVNQEVILGGLELGLSGYPAFNGAYEVGDALVKAGFDVVLHATNHALDKGSQGVLNCLGFWKDNHPEITVIGINASQEEQDTVHILEIKDMKIAVLNYT